MENSISIPIIDSIHDHNLIKNYLSTSNISSNIVTQNTDTTVTKQKNTVYNGFSDSSDETIPEPKIETIPETIPETISGPKTETISETISETILETIPEIIPEPKTDVKIDIKIESQSEIKSETISGFKINPDSKYQNLVLSGGSIRGISLIGAVKELVDKKFLNLKDLKAIAGTSAGAMLSTLIVIGMDIDEIWKFVHDFDIGELINPDPLLFLNKCGFDTGKNIHNFFEKYITEKTGIKHINFRQLYNKTNIHFTIVGTCLTTKETIYFDHINTPNEKVSVALRISIGIPYIFMPFSIGDKQYIDGGVLNNYAMNLFEDRLDKTIGVMIRSDYNTGYTCPEEYFVAIYNIFMYHFFQKNADKYKKNTIYIKESVESISMMNFSVESNIKTKLYDNGILAAHDFINNL